MTIELVAAWGDGLTTLTDVRIQAPSLRVIDCNLLDEEVEVLVATVKLHYATTQCVVLIRSSQRAAWPKPLPMLPRKATSWA